MCAYILKIIQPKYISFEEKTNIKKFYLILDVFLFSSMIRYALSFYKYNFNIIKKYMTHNAYTNI